MKKTLIKISRFIFLFLIFHAALFFCAPYSYASAPAGYSEYFIPGDENIMGQVWADIGGTGGAVLTDPRHTIISVVAWSPNTTLYYDHWEDGYDFDPDDPSTADETYTLVNKGDSRIFESSNIPVNPRGTATYYDGRDRIYVAGGSVTVTRSSWEETDGTVFALAWEVYPVKPQMIKYIMPFGDDLVARGYQDFKRVFALIQATKNNTVVTFDVNKDGVSGDTICITHNNPCTTTATQVTLNQGEVFLLDRFAPFPTTTTVSLQTGTVIQSTETLQVNYIVGDQDANFEARGFSAFPSGMWDNEYYAPVPTDAGANFPTQLYVYNPHSTALIINYQTSTTSGSFSVPAGSTRSFFEMTGGYLPQGSGVYLNASDVFWGVSTIDVGGQSREWGYPLIPLFLIGNEHFFGWAPGAYPPNVTGNEDDSGIFITPVQDNTRVFVDRNNDGTVDYTYTLNRLQTQYVYDATDGDMSNSNVWATGPISIAYGQNPDTSVAGLPSIDLGYLSFPGGDFIDKVLTVTKTANPVVVSTTAGATSVYTLTVNSHDFSVDGISVTDFLPAGWQYVTNSSNITLADMTTLSGAPAEPLNSSPMKYRDNFGTQVYTNNADNLPTGTNWTTNWIEDGEATNPTAGNIQVLQDGALATYALRFNNSAQAIARMANLPSNKGITLSFDYRRVLTAGGQYVDVQVCPIATSATPITCAAPGWQQVVRITSTLATTDSQYLHYQADLTSFLTSSPVPSNFAVRFIGSGGGTVWFDNIQVAADIIWPSSLLGSMAENQTITISFTGQTTQSFSVGDITRNIVQATGTRTVAGATQTFVTSDFDFNSYGDLTVTKTSSATDPLYPGDLFTYTVTVTNPASATSNQTGVAIYDPLPDGVSYIAASGSVTCERLLNVRDEFATVAYTNNGPNNTANWAGAWAETDSLGGGAASGLVLVTGNQLRLGQSENVRDEFATVAYTNNGPNNTANWASNWTETDSLAGGAASGLVLVTGNQLRLGQSENVRDEFGTVAYTNNGPNNTANWASNWTETDPGPGVAGATAGFVWITAGQLQFRYLTSNVRDEFTTNGSYAGNNGSRNWNAAWTETNDNPNGSAATGFVVVTGNYARFQGGGTAPANRAISRTATVTGATSATINFTLTDNGIDAGETMEAHYSIDGGAYVLIGTLDGGTGWSGAVLPLTIALSGNNTLTIRFRAPQVWNSTTNDEARVDNVDISFNSPANAVGSQIQRTANLTGATNATLNFSYSSANLVAGDTLVIEASNNAGGPFTTLATFTSGTPSVAPPYNLTTYISATTTIQFRVTGGFSATNKTFNVDNVDITYQRTPSAIQRTANLTGATSATLNFSYTAANLEAGDTLVVEASNAAGGPFTTLATFAGGTPSPAPPYNLTPYISATTTIQFRITGGYDVTNETLSFDNVDITYQRTPSAIQRTANLAGAVNPLLNFSYSSANLVAGDTLVIEASNNAGGPFTTLATFNGGTPSVAPPYNLTTYISATTTIQFRVTGGFNATNKTFNVDNVDISYYLPSTFASGNPPEFLSKGTGCRIQPGNSLTLTFNVTVDNPLGTGIDHITNTAFINSNEIVLPLSASVTNLVVNPSSQSAEVGDFVWFDTDGDGIQDVGEPGLANVEVALKNWLGATIMTTSTDNGHYLFTGVEPGNGYYVEATASTLPSGLQQSAPSGHSDNRTNSFNLTAGQSYMDADLGYRTAPGTSAIGDLVWSDPNSNSLHDPGEPGLSGVTVQLWRDTNSNGILEPGTDTLCTIAICGTNGTTTTAPNGYYLFAGVTASGAEDYLVYIDGTQAKLTGYTIASNARVITNLSSGSTILSADFGYQGTTYTIIDKLWFDVDADGVLDGGETGISLVTVDLLDASLNVIATTITDANGNFTFSGVEGGSADYTIRISDTNGKLNDYYGTTASAIAGEMQIANLTGNVDNTSAPNFGYSLKSSIGTTAFNDIDSDGIQDTGDFGFSGITVKLYSDINGNGLIDGSDTVISTITTDANGNYLFTGVANGNYVVSIESPPSGYTYIGTDSDSSTTGQQQAASIVAPGNALDKNFRYQATTPRSVAGSIWQDNDEDGVIDASETGMGGVTLDLMQGSTVIATTTTASDGTYSFNNLASGTYIVKVTDTIRVLSGFITTYEKTEGTTGPFNDQETVDLTGGNQTGINFGYKNPTPTLAVISSFEAYEENGKVVVQWQTASEIDTVGFYLFRKDDPKGEYIQINEKLLPGLLVSHQGGTYRYIDKTASPEKTYTYKLVEIENRGNKRTYGPYTVTAGKQEIASPKQEPMTSTYNRKAHDISDAKKSRINAGKLTRKAIRTFTVSSKGKIAVRENGLYYLSASEIASLTGTTTTKIQGMINNNQLLLTNQGQNVAYLSSSDNSGIYFYGQGIDSIYTRENIYWLEKGRGLQMEVITGTGPDPSIGGETFTETFHFEEDHWAATALFDDPQSDYWLWDYIVAGDSGLGSKTFNIKANGVASSSESATLSVHLQGDTDTNTSTDPDHHVVISLNGTKIGEDRWDGIEAHTLELSFNQSLLNEGDNNVMVTGLLDTGAPYSIFYVDSFDLSYQRYYQAVNNRLFVRGDSNPVITIEGFTDPAIFVFDVSNIDQAKLITAATVDHPAADNYRVSFRPASSESLYLALTIDGLSTPVSLIVDKTSKLKERSNRANYLVITPEELKDASQALADYRQHQGLKTMVVELEDIMDEFNYGIYSPEAIRNFLSFAYYNWSKAPRYVVLAGEGTFDYKDNQGHGGNLIPPIMIGTPQGLFPSDNYFADINGDHIPEMAIGRLPVVTPEELTDIIGKTIAYENSSGGTWTKQVLMLADNPDDGGDFSVDSNNVATLLPSGYTAYKIYLSEHPIEEARQMVLNGINNGAFLLNYVGHGGLDRLAQEGLLLTSDVASMTNQNRLPVVTAMTCVVGNFSHPGYDSLSEVLVLKQNGGAVAVWSPTGMSINSEAVILDEMFFMSTFTGRKQTLGDVVLKALEKGSMNGVSGFILDIYNLMGDPALKLK